MSISSIVRFSLAIALGLVIAFSVYGMLKTHTTPAYAEGEPMNNPVNSTLPPQPQPPAQPQQPQNPSVNPSQQAPPEPSQPGGHEKSKPGPGEPGAPAAGGSGGSSGASSKSSGRVALKLLWVAYADYNGLKSILGHSPSKQAYELADAAWSFYMKAREYYGKGDYELSIEYARLSIQASNLAINYIALQSNIQPPG